MSIWRMTTIGLCILTLTLAAYAQEQITDDVTAPPEGEEVMIEAPVEPATEVPIEGYRAERKAMPAVVGNTAVDQPGTPLR